MTNRPRIAENPNEFNWLNQIWSQSWATVSLCRKNPERIWKNPDLKVWLMARHASLQIDDATFPDQKYKTTARRRKWSKKKKNYKNHKNYKKEVAIHRDSPSCPDNDFVSRWLSRRAVAHHRCESCNWPFHKFINKFHKFSKKKWNKFPKWKEILPPKVFR